MKYDAVIIGAGAAGMTCGMYLARAGIKALILEKMFAGGQASQTYSIENYPGFENIDGPTLMNKFKQQAIKNGVEIKTGFVKEIDFDNKTVKTSKEEIEYNALILCMGTQHRKLGVEKEDTLAGTGVSYCATCDGGFFKDKTVAVVGGGNTALEDALYLKNICKKVYLIHRRDEFRGAKTLVDRVVQSENIELLLNSNVTEIYENNLKLDGIKVNDNRIDVDGLFVAVGTTPDTKLVDGKIKLDESKRIIVDKEMRTSMQGVFAAGDVTDTSLRQIVTAAADGAVAANSVEKFLM